VPFEINNVLCSNVENRSEILEVAQCRQSVVLEIVVLDMYIYVCVVRTSSL